MVAYASSTIEVPLSHIDVEAPLLRFRLESGGPAFESLVEDIRQNGQIQPVLLRARGGQKLEVVCGHRRVAALTRLQATSVLAVVRQLDDATALRLCWAENAERENLSDLDKGNAVRIARAEGYNLDEIAGMFKVTVRQLGRWLQLVSEAPPELLQALREGQVTSTHAYAILAALRRQPSLDVRAWVTKVAEEGLSVSQLEAALRAETRPTGRTGRPRRHEFFGREGETLKIRARAYHMTQSSDDDLTHLLHEASALCDVLEQELAIRQEAAAERRRLRAE